MNSQLTSYILFLSMQNAFEIIDLVGDFFDRITDEDSLSSSFLGLGNSSVASFEVDLDLDRLANNTYLAANFDAMFRLGVSLKVHILTLHCIRNCLLSNISPFLCYFKNPMEDSIGSMVSLGIPTWGASALILIDPISLAIRYGDHSVGVRDSSLAASIEMRSQGQYSSTVSGLSETSTSPLIPIISIPVHAEVIFDVNVSDFSISPMLAISSENAIDENITFDFDVGLDTFIESFDLGDIFSNITSLLTELADYGPNFSVGDAPTALVGLFGVVNEAKEFEAALQEFIEIVMDGEFYFHLLLLDITR